MKAFDGRSAVEEYMSTHTLGYSTPDLMLKEFVLWLCEKVDDPNGKENIPRIMFYLKEVEEDRSKSGRDRSQTSLSNLFNTITEPRTITDSDKQQPITDANNTESKFCIECGSKLNLRSMFCTKCGKEQVEV
jgi:ribosomal protein L40E